MTPPPPSTISMASHPPSLMTSGTGRPSPAKRNISFHLDLPPRQQFSSNSITWDSTGPTDSNTSTPANSPTTLTHHLQQPLRLRRTGGSGRPWNRPMPSPYPLSIPPAAQVDTSETEDSQLGDYFDSRPQTPGALDDDDEDAASGRGSTSSSCCSSAAGRGTINLAAEDVDGTTKSSTQAGRSTGQDSSIKQRSIASWAGLSSLTRGRKGRKGVKGFWLDEGE